jgi:hypothetical protein
MNNEIQKSHEPTNPEPDRKEPTDSSYLASMFSSISQKAYSYFNRKPSTDADEKDKKNN